MEIFATLPEHLPKILALLNELEQTSLPSKGFEEAFMENLRDPRIHYLTAEEKGQVVGFLSLHIQFLLHHAGPIAEIQELAVLPETRGRGVGSALLCHAKEIARQEGCSQLEVCCSKTRERAHRFYRREGLRETHFKFCTPL